jgi:hypothetical protein
MIPTAYQIPAALVLLAGGTVACFFGYRFFRVVLAIYGFVFGALITTSLLGPAEAMTLVIGALLGGLVGAVLLNLAYFAGVALMGAAVGAFVLHLVWPMVATGNPHVIAVVIASALGAIGAIWVQRAVIILGTAFGGAWTLLVGALALAGDTAARGAASAPGVWVVYPLHPAPGREWVLWVWLAIGAAGAFLQFRAKPRVKAVKVKRKK